MSGEQPKRLIAAADYFNACFRPLASTERGIHVETIIASTARMAGTMLFRSFAFPGSNFEPGTTVLSEEASVRGPKLMGLLFSTLVQLGHTAEDLVSQDGMSTKDSHFTLQKTQELFDPTILSYCSDKRLNFEEVAFSLAMTSAILVHDCQSLLDIRSGIGIALYGFVEGSKTAPIAISLSAKSFSSKTNEVKKPWYKWW